MVLEVVSNFWEFFGPYGWLTLITFVCINYVFTNSFSEFFSTVTKRLLRDEALEARNEQERQARVAYIREMQSEEIARESRVRMLEREAEEKRKKYERRLKLEEERKLLPKSVQVLGKNTVKIVGRRTAEEILDGLIESRSAVLLTKSFCPFSRKAKVLLSTFRLTNDEYVSIDLDELRDVDVDAVQNLCQARYGHKSVPMMFLSGKFIGGHDSIIEMCKDDRLLSMIQ